MGTGRSAAAPPDGARCGSDRPRRRVATITAAQDEIVPPARTEALRAALGQTEPGIVFDQTLAAGHNDLYGHPNFADTLARAMTTLTRADPVTPGG